MVGVDRDIKKRWMVFALVNLLLVILIFGALIAGLFKAGAKPENLLEDTIDYGKILDFACKCGAYTTTGYGAIPSMGNRETVDKAVR